MLLGPPLNLTVTHIGSGTIQLYWIPSNGEQTGSYLNYTVLIKDGKGAVAYNETVTNLQLIINTLDQCSQKNVTVIPQCQGTISEASIGGLQIPGGN